MNIVKNIGVIVGGMLFGIYLFVGYDNIINKDVTSSGLVPMYTSLDELSNESNIIVKASVLKDSKDIEKSMAVGKDATLFKDHSLSARLYQVKIEEVLKNQTDLKLKQNTNIELIQKLGISNKGQFGPFEDSGLKLEEGTYLFYLIHFESQIFGKKVFMPKTLKHIYKLNESTGEYENITGDTLEIVKLEDAVNASE
ncbi:hypothetical protein [Brevibacillus dissolubilis]|uniref:hypothetical protein n=1 Tax=Brevibacillus dissolubilis TaxID=1844116 RepID=UPI0011178186|nr:hypothetical protein [Brevibacillus dissolubilis]